MPTVRQQMLRANSGGSSQKLAVTTASIASAAINGENVNIFCTVDCFIRQGEDPVAVATGVDQFIPAGVLLNVSGITKGSKLAIISNGSVGTAFISPG